MFMVFLEINATIASGYLDKGSQSNSVPSIQDKSTLRLPSKSSIRISALVRVSNLRLGKKNHESFNQICSDSFKLSYILIHILLLAFIQK